MNFILDFIFKIIDRVMQRKTQTIDVEKKLSKHFTVDEFCISQTATRHGIDNTPDETQIKNMKRLCKTILEPLREAHKKPILISSGFRCKKLNKKVKGSKTSQHCKGQAADFTINGITVKEIINWIIKVDLQYHQLIDEYGRWVHVSCSHTGKKPRKEVFSMQRINGRKKRVKYEGN